MHSCCVEEFYLHQDHMGIAVNQLVFELAKKPDDVIIALHKDKGKDIYFNVCYVKKNNLFANLVKLQAEKGYVYLTHTFS